MIATVSWKFNIGIEKAKEKLRVTRQKGIRHYVHTLHQRYRAYHMQLNRKRFNTQFSTDHVLEILKYLEEN